ncbi:MAG: MATE family efflux transporter [Acutalibacteraceae bacterium]|nr:MATE family efflux transporter [Acutalibacteraceae bacterium]
MENTQNILGTERVSKLMLKFAIPSIIAMLVGAIYNIVDQLFIGNAVGPLGNAATNIAFPLSTSCVALALLFGIGGASCFNLDMGKGESKKAPNYIGNSVVMMIISGILLMVVTLLFLEPLLKIFGSPDDVMPYAVEYTRITAFGFPFLILTTGGGHLIRADGSPKMTMFVSMLGAVINVFLDALFVIVFGWGMSGAAYATIIGQFISALVVFWYLKHFKTVSLSIRNFKPNAKIIGKTASIGMASFINQLAMMIVQIVLNNFLRKYGGMSEFGESIPIACAGIIMKVNQIIFSIIIGLSQGTQPIESYNYGAEKYDRVRRAYRLAITVGAVISLIAFALFEIFPKEILSLFGDGSKEYFKFGVLYFRIFSAFLWIGFIQPITSTFFTSIGKPIKGAILSLSKNIICFLPALFILPQFFGIYGVLYATPLADFLAVVMNISFAIFEFKLIKSKEKDLQSA